MRRYFLPACLPEGRSDRNEDDGCQFTEAAVKGVHFPPVRARDNLRRCGVSATTDQLHSDAYAGSLIF